MSELITAAMAAEMARNAHKQVQEDWISLVDKHIKNCAKAGKYSTDWLDYQDIDSATIDIFKVDLGYKISYSSAGAIGERYIKISWAETE